MTIEKLAIKDKMADRKRNGRWWMVGYLCGVWRAFPAWYEVDARTGYCGHPEHELSPGHYAVRAERCKRPALGQPRTGEGSPWR